jgi:hypothetical protein
MSREPREIWEKRVQRWADSGLTAKEFAEEVGVNVHTLAGWKWRLSAGARQTVTPRPSTTPASFIEVVAPLVAAPEGPEVQIASRPPVLEPLELVLSTGIRLRIPIGFDHATRRRVVDALEGR